MRVILGIGNPGPTYASTRHNVGWLALDALAERFPEGWAAASGPYLEKGVVYGNMPCLLVKPLTYVNRTGEAAVAACERHGVALSDLLVVVDDVHLPLGRLRLRQGGASGGHNGLQSLEERLGTRQFPRLRVGVGAPPHFGALVNHVLSPFTSEEEPVVRSVVGHAAAIAEAFGREGYAEAVTAYSRWRQWAALHPPTDSSVAL